MMDTYFPKTRRPMATSIKRPLPTSIDVTPPKAKIIATPKDRPKKAEPPPAPKKIKPKPACFRKLFNNSQIPKQPDLKSEKIDQGPLKGISTSLLELVRAKEAASKILTPEKEKEQKLLGIAPEIARIVPTIFTASKKSIMSYDKVVDYCCKSLKMNYTSTTVDECLTLMDTIAPEWISIVNISRGRYMRLNRDNYTIPQLLEAIKRFKKNC